ncbi:thyroid adenoma-associated-like protein [Tasmannia lanceolata]|uniref:thyroid adenoma-associated-like protein n=1 Tax=Tasmannia lanceolata TaxID=3420 RepID=UPI0040629B02
MSAKWRALQHRHRYTYSAVIFPRSYIETLNELPLEISSLNFFSELKEFVSLNSVYSQINAAKKLASTFANLLGSRDMIVVSAASRFYLEILFIENSLPLHRTLISVLAKNCSFQSVLTTCFRTLCEEYSVSGGGRGRRFSVPRAALSLLSYPKLGFFVETVEECAVSVALDVGFGLKSVITDINSGSRPSPIVMEQCQEAMSCLYYLLQRFPLKFVNGECIISEDSTSFEIIVRTILNVMKLSAFSRDCLVAAGVSFCVALQACFSPQELAVFIVRSIFQGCKYTICSESGFESLGSKMPYKGDLYSEIGDFSVLSRLCLLRGIVTAVPRTVLNIHFVESREGLNGFDIHGSNSNVIWTILFDGILPELCNYCENPIDSHFNFHALTVTQICLQQIKTSILANITNLSGNYDPFPEYMTNRILRIIWNNLEDPLNQTVKQVHLIFELLLDIQSTLWSVEGSERKKSFLRRSTLDLLHLGPRCKGRYVPLAYLTRRLGAMTVLEMNPNLLFETIHAYIDDDVCCSVTSFLKCFLECLRDECWNDDGIEKGYIAFRGLCLPPILHGLVSGLSKLRSNLNTYALPVVLEVDVDSIFPMLAFISIGQSGEESKNTYPELASANMALTLDQCVAALVSLLKVSRLLALIEGDIDWCSDASMLQEETNLHKKSFKNFAFVHVKMINVKIPVEWLVLALTHVDHNLRIDAAESLFINPKAASLPSPLELSLMKEAVPLNMRCCSTAFQMKWNSLFRKFFSRVRTALERQVKQGGWQPLASSGNNEDSIDNDAEKLVVQRAVDLFYFMKWLSCFLFYSCYPSAPYERKTMAMELILIMISVWPIALSQEKCSSISASSSLYPYSEGFTLPDSTLSLVGSIVDSWDRLRESSFRILLHFPSPLPGISSQDAVKEVITWAKRLVCSPRVRESDAGALTLRLIFRKYVLELGWTVGVSVDVICLHPSELINCDLQSPVIEYILSLVDWLRVVVEEGERDLLEACQNSFVHGVLLTLRYSFEELDWNSVAVLSSSSKMRRALEKLLELVMRVTSLALWVVSADAWYMPEDMDDTGGDDTLLLDIPVDMVTGSSSELRVKDLEPEESPKPEEPVVMVGCWLAIKEVSLLLGTIIRKIPLPSCTFSDRCKPGDPLCEATDVHPMPMSDVVLDLEQLEMIGNHFLEILLKMKHYGAIDKTRAGFTALCNRLLCSNDPRLCKMTESWMEHLMERTVAKDQTVDDLLRRSAGIPAAFLALFLSEPEGTPKKLLPRALRWLINVASMSLLSPGEVNSQNGEARNSSSGSSPVTEKDVNGKISKIRDEGVIPTVHAFNVLRASFNDTHLATDVSGFCAEALIISIRSFSSPYWEVRNSACLAYTALVRRMIGFLNVQKRESARRALTSLEFFHRYPALHPFLVRELKIATESLGYLHQSKSNLAKVVHPSLCPMLILLSRLKPSIISSETEDPLDPFLLMPFIERCATQSNLRIRILASRALAGLISNEKLQTVLHNIVCGLSHGRNQMTVPEGIGPTSSTLVTISNGRKNEIPRIASFNSIHGILLQLSSLLDINCRSLTDFSKKDQILGDLLQVLVKFSWIGSTRLCPCPTLNGSYLHVLDLILGIARKCGISRYVSTTRSLLLELSSECLDTDLSCRSKFYDPTNLELRRQATASYLNCMLGESLKVAETESYVGGLQERVMCFIHDGSYEVRLTALKWLLQFLKSTESGSTNNQCLIGIGIIQWAKTTLQPTLIKNIAVEENPKCVCYILRILFVWNSMQVEKPSNLQCKDKEIIYVGMMDYDSLVQFWDTLTSMNKVLTHMKTREALIRCMGICAKRFGILFLGSLSINHSHIRSEIVVDSSRQDQSERLATIYEFIDSFIILIKQHSASSEPVNMRKTAAESMIVSGLLEQALSISTLVSNNQIPSEVPFIHGDEKKISYLEDSNVVDLYAHRILDLWFTCIKLLEDEDIGLRQALAMNVQRCLTSKESASRHVTGVVPTQVEKVIESSFEFLSSIFGHWFEYLDCILRWVLDVGSHAEARGDLVRRVFDKEIDNHHEERLLVCQLCCFQLEKLLISRSWAVGSYENGLNEHVIRIFLQKWRRRFLQQLISLASNYLKPEGGVNWIGGLGNHKDAFTSLYANLLGLYALSKCPLDNHLLSLETEIDKPPLSDIVELRGIIRPFLRNPLISNLYLLVTQSLERMFGVTLSPLDSKNPGDLSVWEGFDPYFLLR